MNNNEINVDNEKYIMSKYSALNMRNLAFQNLKTDILHKIEDTAKNGNTEYTTDTLYNIGESICSDIIKYLTVLGYDVIVSHTLNGCMLTIRWDD